MTLAEAWVLAGIVQEVDGGCRACVEGLVRELNAAFPQFTWKRLDKVRRLAASSGG